MNSLKALREDFVAATTFAQKQQAIEKHCDVLPIDSASEIRDGDLLLAISQSKQHLIVAVSPAIDGGALQIRSAMDGSPMKAVPSDKVKQSIARSKLHRLVLLAGSESSHQSQRQTDEVAMGFTASPVQQPAEYTSKISIQQRDQILDSGAFSQLVDAAQRSGIVPGVGIIIQVRDCEFRLGKYHQALQLIESLLSSFVGSATQRTQRLKREEQEIASGRVKMSPKDLLAKRARDNKESECVERARMKFTRVLEGIRAIIQLENEKEPLSR